MGLHVKLIEKLLERPAVAKKASRRQRKTSPTSRPSSEPINLDKAVDNRQHDVAISIRLISAYKKTVCGRLTPAFSELGLQRPHIERAQILNHYCGQH